MGSGSSASIVEPSHLGDNQQREHKRKEALARVETFVVNAYANSSKVESTWLVLSSDTGQLAFTNFVKGVNAEDTLQLFKELSMIRSKRFLSDDPRLARALCDVYNRFLKFTLETRFTATYRLQSQIEEVVERLSSKDQQSSSERKELPGMLPDSCNGINADFSTNSAATTLSTLNAVSIKMEEPISARSAISTDNNRFTLLSIDPNAASTLSPPATPMSPTKNELLSLIVRLQDEVVQVLATQLFHRFLTSKNYSSWRATDSSHARATTANDATSYSSQKKSRKFVSRWSFLNVLSRSRSVDSHGSNPDSVKASTDNEHPSHEKGVTPENIGRKGSIIITEDGIDNFDLQGMAVRNSPLKSSMSDTNSKKIRATMRLVTQPSNMTFTALGSIAEQQLQDIVGRPDSWLSVLISASELLPVAVSVASVAQHAACSAKLPFSPRDEATSSESSQEQIYQLIFVNKAFEKLTGYDRSRVQGKAMKDFLQCPQSEPQAIATQSLALQSKQEVVTSITSKKANGSRFKHLVGLKPVLGGKDDYILGVHFDISNVQDNGASHMQLAASLLNYLPNCLLASENESTEELTPTSNKCSGWW